MDEPGGGRQAQRLSRRKFLTVAGSAGVAVAATQFPFARARTAPARFTGYPFTLAVASGDPTPDGVVLWTRLAPSPLAGNGGMPEKPITVEWEVSKNDSFTDVVARGEEIATYGDAHAVHAEPRGLESGYEYHNADGSRVVPARGRGPWRRSTPRPRPPASFPPPATRR